MCLPANLHRAAPTAMSHGRGVMSLTSLTCLKSLLPGVSGVSAMSAMSNMRPLYPHRLCCPAQEREDPLAASARCTARAVGVRVESHTAGRHTHPAVTSHTREAACVVHRCWGVGVYLGREVAGYLLG